MFDYESTRLKLEKLYEATLSLQGFYTDQVREFIDVGEYGLALDGIADVYLSKGILMPDALFMLFQQLANDMDLASDPEFSAVLELRKAHAASR